MITKAVWYPQGGAWWVERLDPDGSWRILDGHIGSRWVALFKAWRWSMRETGAVHYQNGRRVDQRPEFVNAEFLRKR